MKDKRTKQRRPVEWVTPEDPDWEPGLRPRKRTGLRRPVNYLKTWDDPDWSRRLTKRLSVGMVDEELPFGKEGGRKSWYLSLTVDPDLATTLGPVRGVPRKGRTVLLFEDDVVALVDHVMHRYLVVFNDDVALNGHAHYAPRRRAKR